MKNLKVRILVAAFASIVVISCVGICALFDMLLKNFGFFGTACMLLLVFFVAFAVTSLSDSDCEEIKSGLQKIKKGVKSE